MMNEELAALSRCKIILHSKLYNNESLD